MMTRLFIADVSELCIEKALERVTDYRRHKTLRLPNDEKKRQSLGAELLLYEALNRSEPFSYLIGENGKPYLDDGRHFSLSHCKSHVLCAVSDFDLGCDIELPREGSLRLAERFFTEKEQRLIKNAEESDGKFCELWVLKESYIKATGMGLKTPLDSFSAAGHIGEYSTAHFTHGDFHLAVCLKSPSIGEIEIYDKKII